MRNSGFELSAAVSASSFPPTTCNPLARHWPARNDYKKEDRYSNDDRRPHRSQSRHRNFGDDEKRDPGNDGAIDHADDGLAKRFGITTGGKEAACRNEPLLADNLAFPHEVIIQTNDLVAANGLVESLHLGQKLIGQRFAQCIIADLTRALALAQATLTEADEHRERALAEALALLPQ